MYFCECMTLFPWKYIYIDHCGDVTRLHGDVQTWTCVVLLLLCYIMPSPCPRRPWRFDVIYLSTVRGRPVGCRWWFSGLAIIYGPNRDRNERGRAAENDYAMRAFRRTFWRLNSARLIPPNLTQPNRPMTTATSISATSAIAAENLSSTSLSLLIRPTPSPLEGRFSYLSTRLPGTYRVIPFPTIDHKAAT